MSTFNPSENSQSRFINQRHLGGIEHDLIRAYDIESNQDVLLRKNVSSSQIQRAKEIASLDHPLLSKLLEVYGTDLVYKCPASNIETLLVGQRQYPVEVSKKLAECFLALFRFLGSRQLILRSLRSDDVLIDSDNIPLLINHDNIVQLTQDEARSKRAIADIARLLMQMDLGCDYGVVKDCVEYRDGRYFLKSMPPGVNATVAKSIKELFANYTYQAPTAPPRPTNLAYQRLQLRIVRTTRRFAPIIIVAAIIGTPVYLHYDHKAKLEAVARQEAQRRERERLAAEKRAREARDACIAAIEQSKPGDCRGQDLTGIDASNSDLRDIQLDGANLSKANLTGVNLSGTKLTEVNFSNANLRTADLSAITSTDVIWNGADLMNASLVGANLQSADFSEAKLGEVDLDNADISHANFSGVNLSNQKLSGVKAVKTNFQNAYLKGIVFSGGEYSQANFDGADLTSAFFEDGVFIDESSFTNVVLASARFSGATVHTTTFAQANLQDIIIEDSEFSGVSFISSNIQNSQFINSLIEGGKFTGSDLSDAVVEGTSFRTMDFKETRLSGASFTNCNFYRASFFNPGWGTSLRNVVMPDGRTRNPISIDSTDKD